MRFVERFLNGAEASLSDQTRLELTRIIGSGIPCTGRPDTNKELRKHLHACRWQGEFRVGVAKRFAIDFFKDGVGIEVELRQGTNLIHDLLKLERASRRGLIHFGILVTYDKSVAIHGKSGQNACVQELEAWLAEFHGLTDLRLPIWVIGLLDC